MTKKVTVAGGGVLGSQIAFQCAYKGMDTTIWLRSPESIGRTMPKLEKVLQAYIADLRKAADHPELLPAGLKEEGFDARKAIERAQAAFDAIHIELDLEKAVQGADIVIESMTEDPKAKAAFYGKLAPVLGDHTILLTNSSTLLPSAFAGLTGAPERYLALHFANSIWRNNLTEVMAQPQTDPAVFEKTVEFARKIGMDPVKVNKEKSGYLLNSLLVPFLFSALDLYVTGTASPQDIDKAWIKGAGAPYGPFAMLDVIGLQTPRNIVHQYARIPDEIAPFHYKDIEKELSRMIDAGEKFYS